MPVVDQTRPFPDVGGSRKDFRYRSASPRSLKKCASPLFILIEQKAAKDAERRDLCDLRDLLLRILEQKGIAVPERRFAASGLLAFLNEAKK